MNNRIRALHAPTADRAVGFFLRQVPALATPLTDLLHHGPAAPIWRPVQDLDAKSHGDTGTP